MHDQSLIRELDVVVIPDEIALNAGAVKQGTVVWYVAGADFATVECSLVGGDPIHTVLIDVPVSELKRIQTGGS